LRVVVCFAAGRATGRRPVLLGGGIGKGSLQVGQGVDDGATAAKTLCSNDSTLQWHAM